MTTSQFLDKAAFSVFYHTEKILLCICRRASAQWSKLPLLSGTQGRRSTEAESFCVTKEAKQVMLLTWHWVYGQDMYNSMLQILCLFVYVHSEIMYLSSWSPDIITSLHRPYIDLPVKICVFKFAQAIRSYLPVFSSPLACNSMSEHLWQYCVLLEEFINCLS